MELEDIQDLTEPFECELMPGKVIKGRFTLENYTDEVKDVLKKVRRASRDEDRIRAGREDKDLTDEEYAKLEQLEEEIAPTRLILLKNTIVDWDVTKGGVILPIRETLDTFKPYAIRKLSDAVRDAQSPKADTPSEPSGEPILQPGSVETTV